MSLPTESDLKAGIGKALIQYKELYAFLATASPSFLTRDNAALTAIPGDSMPGAVNAQRAHRAAHAAAMSTMGPHTMAFLETYRRVLGLNPSTPVLSELFRYYGENSKTVLSRGFSFGSISAGGSNVGTGTMTRLTKDEFNCTIESGYPEAKTWECVQDAHTGSRRHNELFVGRGVPAGIDACERIGSGISQQMKVLSIDDSQAAGFPNCGFENVSGSTGSLTAITNWNVGSSISNFDTISTDYYKDVPGSTARSLRIQGNDYIYQTFAANRVNWPANVPMYAQIAFKRESSCDGTLTLTIGGKSTSVALSAQSGWTILKWKTDTDCWLRNWNTSDPASSLTSCVLKVALSGRTTGTLLIDDLIVAPWTPFDGAFVVVNGGATPYLQRDVFTATDTSSDTGIIQTQLAWGLHAYLPHAGSSPTWAEPT